jgi:hypothetical protein
MLCLRATRSLVGEWAISPVSEQLFKFVGRPIIRYSRLSTVNEDKDITLNEIDLHAKKKNKNEVLI